MSRVAKYVNSKAWWLDVECWLSGGLHPLVSFIARVCTIFWVRFFWFPMRRYILSEDIRYNPYLNHISTLDDYSTDYDYRRFMNDPYIETDSFRSLSYRDIYGPQRNSVEFWASRERFWWQARDLGDMSGNVIDVTFKYESREEAKE